MRFLILIALFFLLGCTQSNERIIEEAERMTAAGNPDSALHIINRIYDPAKLDSRMQARYSIALAQIHTEKGIALTGDSLLRNAYDYYRTTEPIDSARLMKAIYLASSHYWWCGEKEKSYAILEKALADGMKKNDTAQTISILRMLCMQHGLDNDFGATKKYLKQLIECDKDPDMAFTYRYNLAVCNFFSGDTAAANLLLSDLENYVHTMPDSLTYWKYALRSQADIASDGGDQHEAMRLQEKALQHFRGDSAEMAFSYLSMARYRLLLSDTDGATDYIELTDRLLPSSMLNNLSEAGSRQILNAVIGYAKNRSFNMKEYALFVNNLEDSEKSERMIAAAKDCSNQQLTERNLNLIIARQREQVIATVASCVCILAIAGFIFMNRRRKRILEEKDEELEALRSLIAESDKPATDKDDRFFKKIMLRQLGVIRIAAGNPTTANQELLKRMSEIANKEVAVDSLLDWADLYKTIDYIYDGFHTKLMERFGNLLNEKEIQLCCLLRANFSTKEISIVTQQGVRTVYQRKTVIRQKLQMEEKGDIAGFLSEK